MDEQEYLGTRAQREPILIEILEGYVPRRIDVLREKLPLEIFTSSSETPPLAERRDKFVRELNNLEDSLLAGGCQPYETFRSAYRQIIPIMAMDFRDATGHYKMRVINEVPRDLAKKASDALHSNPLYQELQNPDYPNWTIKLGGWEGLAHPVIFRRLFTFTREFLDGMYDHLCTYVPELSHAPLRQ